MKAKCILFTQVDKVELGEIDIPEKKAEEVLIETTLSCISPGTELRCLGGKQEGLGLDAFPFVPGYSIVGRILKADAEGRHKEGSLVFCAGNRRGSLRCAWGGHISHAVTKASEVYAIPEGISIGNAALIKLAAIAYRGFRISDLRETDRVIALGLGPIGQLSARIFSAAGNRVVAADLSADRVRIAQTAGLKAVQIAADDLSTLREIMPQGAEVVIDATGFAPALNAAASLVVDKAWDESNPAPGRLIIQGSYAQDVLFPQNIAFAKELQVLWPRDNQICDMEAVGLLMAQGKLDAADLLGETHRVADAAKVYAELRAAKGNILTAVFDWQK